jgi:hypothetical protein
MPVGNQPTVAGINQSLSSLAIQMRNLMQQVKQFDQKISALGATGLENIGGTGQGFNPADAASVIQLAGFLNKNAGVYFGTDTQATASNFDAALTVVWGDQ